MGISFEIVLHCDKFPILWPITDDFLQPGHREASLGSLPRNDDPPPETNIGVNKAKNGVILVLLIKDTELGYSSKRLEYIANY